MAEAHATAKFHQIYEPVAPSRTSDRVVVIIPYVVERTDAAAVKGMPALQDPTGFALLEVNRYWMTEFERQLREFTAHPDSTITLVTENLSIHYDVPPPAKPQCRYYVDIKDQDTRTLSYAYSTPGWILPNLEINFSGCRGLLPRESRDRQHALEIHQYAYYRPAIRNSIPYRICLSPLALGFDIITLPVLMF